jgi:pimeloyl-ACP methyl ester carboxylesterase
MNAGMERIELPGGTVADVLLAGAPDGFPLVMHHGTPSDASLFADWHDDCARHGLRLICTSRPGYATSPRRAGRTVASVAEDVGALLDHLGHRRFVTAGWSGGGPHALACAARWPGRCVGVATLAGVGPSDAPDLDFTAMMGPENVDEFGAARRGEAAIAAWMTANAGPFRSISAAALADGLGGLVPQIDRDALAAGHAERLASSFRRALAAGFDGWIDDDLAFVRPWGFDLGKVLAPVTVWQGELDLMVPLAHGRWLASHMPAAQARIVSGQGHISLVTAHRGEILAALSARAQAASEH